MIIGFPIVETSTPARINININNPSNCEIRAIGVHQRNKAMSTFNRPANAIKTLRLITYTEPPEPTFKDKAGSDLSDKKQKLELYKYEALLNKLDK